ncbi:MAG: SIR2 family protein [Proteobacteria bacterium]|jgi:hypothetical protein|nr:SIR2 family protein [Pseudomonadota bacterium]
MTVIQDPNRQVSYLQQCLSSDKRPLALFLGAGCPVSIRVGPAGLPLIPDIRGLTDLVRKTARSDEQCAPLFAKIEALFVEDEFDNPSVEDMLTYIRALHAVAGKASVRDLSALDLDNLDRMICTAIHNAANKQLPNDSSPYHRLATWVNAVRRDNPVEVFTTNYDLLMEQAFEDYAVPYFDGFAGVRRPFFDLRAMEEDMLPLRWARLWKIHGSINWYQGCDGGVFRGAANEDEESKRVIHPSHLKYQQSRRLPYLAMIDRLRAFMKKPGASLVLCGYSFRDEHLNEVIVQGLECSQTATAFALMHSVCNQYPQARILAERRPNLSILCKDGGVIGGRDFIWPSNDGKQSKPCDTDWVKWEVLAPDQNPDATQAVFNLGDFVVLGRFLAELAGIAVVSNGE